jgi:AraC-like DNA-binding protein
MDPAPPTRQRLGAWTSIPRHTHREGYAALILAGGYEEAGEFGRRRLEAGDVALHDGFSSHRNGVGARDVALINLPLAGLASGFARSADPDRVARLAETDPVAAVESLREGLEPIPAQTLDWPDLLALDLKADPELDLGAWAARLGLAASTLSRGFGRLYGVTPKRYRHEVKTRRALTALSGGWSGSLALLALDSGFADQAHMTHAVAGLTGTTPGAWRGSTAYKAG